MGMDVGVTPMVGVCVCVRRGGNGGGGVCPLPLPLHSIAQRQKLWVTQLSLTLCQCGQKASIDVRATTLRSTPPRSGKMLAYNCSPSFNWKQLLSNEEISTFQVCGLLPPSGRL